MLSKNMMISNSPAKMGIGPLDRNYKHCPHPTTELLWFLSLEPPVSPVKKKKQKKSKTWLS